MARVPGAEGKAAVTSGSASDSGITASAGMQARIVPAARHERTDQVKNLRMIEGITEGRPRFVTSL